jgi:hypothetical protein
MLQFLVESVIEGIALGWCITLIVFLTMALGLAS